MGISELIDHTVFDPLILNVISSFVNLWMFRKKITLSLRFISYFCALSFLFFPKKYEIIITLAIFSVIQMRGKGGSLFVKILRLHKGLLMWYFCRKCRAVLVKWCYEGAVAQVSIGAAKNTGYKYITATLISAFSRHLLVLPYGVNKK